jgi:hypothetical protein
VQICLLNQRLGGIGPSQVLVGARKASKCRDKIGAISASLRAKGGRWKGAHGQNVGAPGNDSCPGPTPVAVDLLEDPLGTDLVLTGSRILW